MSSFKQLNKSDVTHVPYAANKQWNLNYPLGYPTSSEYITIYKGTNLSGSFDPIMDPVTEGQYERLVYDQINHLFYHVFSGSFLDTSSLANSLLYESASKNYATSSYFIYDENPNLIKNFPTGTNEGIRVLAVNQEIYGNKLLPYNFKLTSSAYSIKDDGNGNVYDSGSIHIGNIFYPQGLVIITNQAYQEMFPLPPLAVADMINVRASDLIKTGSILTNDIARFGTLDTGSIVLSGSADELALIKLTGSFSQSVAMYADFPIINANNAYYPIIPSNYKFFQQGKYDIHYTVNSILENGAVLTSNKALARFNVLPPDCDFEFNVIFIPPTPTPTATQTPTQTLTSTNTPTNTQTQTNTSTSTSTPTNTQTSTNTQTQTNSQTATNTPTQTLTSTPTQTLTRTLTSTPTPTPTLTSTSTPTQTLTATQVPTQTPTATPTQTLTRTLTATSTPTQTLTRTLTGTSTPTQTLTATNTPTQTLTRTLTATQTPTQTLTRTLTSTNTPTQTLTRTLTSTNTPTQTLTKTLTQTLTNTQTQTNTQTSTNTPTQTLTATLPVGTINWSISEYSEPGVFLDANIKIIRVSDGYVYVDAFSGAGSVQIATGTQVYVYGYVLTANAPPTFWGPTYNRATLGASVAGITSGTTTLFKTSGDFEVSSGNFTVSAGTTYTANVATINPYSTTGNVVSIEFDLYSSNPYGGPCSGIGIEYSENYTTNCYFVRAYNTNGLEISNDTEIEVPILDQYGTLVETQYVAPTKSGVVLLCLDYAQNCYGNISFTQFGTPKVNNIGFNYNNATFRYDRPS